MEISLALAKRVWVQLTSGAEHYLGVVVCAFNDWVGIRGWLGGWEGIVGVLAGSLLEFCLGVVHAGDSF